jgi:hypothetical protein
MLSHSESRVSEDWQKEKGDNICPAPAEKGTSNSLISEPRQPSVNHQKHNPGVCFSSFEHGGFGGLYLNAPGAVAIHTALLIHEKLDLAVGEFTVGVSCAIGSPDSRTDVDGKQLLWDIYSLLKRDIGQSIKY